VQPEGLYQWKIGNGNGGASTICATAYPCNSVSIENITTEFDLFSAAAYVVGMPSCS
jgi:hypothetical protein